MDFFHNLWDFFFCNAPLREIHQESAKIKIEIYQYINQIVYLHSESLNTCEISPLKPY